MVYGDLPDGSSGILDAFSFSGSDFFSGGDTQILSASYGYQLSSQIKPVSTGA